MSIYENIKKNPLKYRLLTNIHNYTIGRNKLFIKDNILETKTVLLKKVKFNIKGTNNHIFIDDLSILKNCNFEIYGNDNNIFIGKMCYLSYSEFWIEDNNNSIVIGEKVTVSGKTQFAAIESTKITIGNNCLFSSDINLRTGDSHSILDLKGNRINPSLDIIVKDHVWIGNKSMLLKGVIISQDSIVSAGSIVTKKFNESNVIIAGVPGKIIKTNINWQNDRIKVVK